VARGGEGVSGEPATYANCYPRAFPSCSAERVQHNEIESSAGAHARTRTRHTRTLGPIMIVRARRARRRVRDVAGRAGLGGGGGEASESPNSG
jgi:hypothetical protein